MTPIYWRWERNSAKASFPKEYLAPAPPLKLTSAAAVDDPLGPLEGLLKNRRVCIDRGSGSISLDLKRLRSDVAGHRILSNSHGRGR